jgi:hypothetical protein
MVASDGEDVLDVIELVGFALDIIVEWVLHHGSGVTASIAAEFWRMASMAVARVTPSPFAGTVGSFCQDW